MLQAFCVLERRKNYFFVFLALVRDDKNTLFICAIKLFMH